MAGKYTVTITLTVEGEAQDVNTLGRGCEVLLMDLEDGFIPLLKATCEDAEPSMGLVNIRGVRVRAEVLEGVATEQQERDT